MNQWGRDAQHLLCGRLNKTHGPFGLANKAGLDVL